MQRSHYKPVVVAAIVTAAAAFIPSYALAGAAFTGHYSGRASVSVSGSSIKISSVKGTGSGTLGSGKLTGSNGSGHTHGSCGFFKGPATISGSKGSLSISVQESKSKGCGSGSAVAVSGVASVTGGSGKFKKSKGNLRFSGSYNKAKGTFTVTFTGSV